MWQFSFREQRDILHRTFWGSLVGLLNFLASPSKVSLASVGKPNWLSQASKETTQASKQTKHVVCSSFLPGEVRRAQARREIQTHFFSGRILV